MNHRTCEDVDSYQVNVRLPVWVTRKQATKTGLVSTQWDVKCLEDQERGVTRQVLVVGGTSTLSPKGS